MNPWPSPDGWHFYDRSLTSAQVVKQLYRAIFEQATKTGMLVQGCNVVGHLGVGFMQINRTGDDTSGLQWERTRQIGVNTLAFRLPQHGSFYATDADCVGISDSIDWELNRQWMDLLARTGTPLFFSARPGSLTAGQEDQLRQALALASTGGAHETKTPSPNTKRYQNRLPNKVLPANASSASNCKSKWRKPVVFSTSPAFHPTTQSENNTRPC